MINSIYQIRKKNNFAPLLKSYQLDRVNGFLYNGQMRFAQCIHDR